MILALAAFVCWDTGQASAQTYAQLYPAGIGFNPAVNYTLANFAYSPNIRKFVDSLPGLTIANKNNLGQYIPVAIPDTTKFADADFYDITCKEYTEKMHSDLPPTKLRGYAQVAGTGPGQTTDPTVGGVNQYLGPVIIAKVYDPNKAPGVNGNGKPVRLLFRNQLPLTSAGKFFLPIDPTVMGAGMGPVMGQSYTHNRVTIPHLHGGHSPWISDGTPHQFLTPAGENTPYKKGVSFVNVPDMVGAGKLIPSPNANDGMATLYWSNQQSGRLMFYHDHAWGTTRLNPYAGVAAGYLLIDPVEEDLIAGTNVTGGNPAAVQILPDGTGLDKSGLGLYRYGIPLVIQDKSFVNDATTPPGAGFPAGYTPTQPTLVTDPLWGTYVGTGGGNLWMGHEYLPIENIFDPTGVTPTGRWDYAPFMIPPMMVQNLTPPSPTIIPEAFGDTMMVNGTCFPYVELPPDAIRFRILSAGNDRVLNLSWFLADPAKPTEVKMVDAAPNAAFPTWPRDGRDGGVPDPLTKGPDWLLLGNESGFLAQMATLPAQPVDYEYNRQTIPLLGVTSHSLLLLPAQRADVVVDFRQYKDGDILILYNDAPAAMSNYWPINDFYSDGPDLTAAGGAPTIPPGFGPNTRTVMQVRIKGTKPSTFNFDKAALATALPKAFAISQPKPIVPALAYNAAYPGFAASDIYAQSPDTTLNVTGAPGPITRIKAVIPGNNYTAIPRVTIVGGGGSGATARATLNGVTAIVVTTFGSGYTGTPTVTVAPPNVAGGIQCTVAATVSGGQVQSIEIIEPGSGYTLAPLVTITGGGGAGATATATIMLNSVGSIVITNPGSGYTRQPMVYITGGNGMGASAVALTTGSLPMTGKMITEGFDPEFGRMYIQLGSLPNPLTPNVGNGPVIGLARYIDPPTEMLKDGEVIVWRIGHLGVDSHSLHFHLMDVQVVNRVSWTNDVLPPYANELGWNESIRTNPMEDIIVAARPTSMYTPFVVPNSNRLLDPSTPAGSTTNFMPIAPLPGIPVVAQLTNVMTNFAWEYVWHCHMLGHEENDFMRPLCMVVVPPLAPNTLRVTGSTGSAPIANTLTWVDNAPGQAFTIQRATNANFTGNLKSWTVGASLRTWTDNDPALLGRTRYYYRIAAFNSAGNSAWSNVVNLTTAVGPPPAVPTGVASGTITRTSIQLTWTNPAPNAASFVIQRATNAAFTNARSVTLNTANAGVYNVTGLTRNTTYYFRIQARNAAGTTTWSATFSATTLP